jgi:hypothetical protein
MLLENKETVYVDKFVMSKKKRWKQTLQIDKRILRTSILPTDECPVTHFTFAHYKNPNKTYGVIHYIKDLVKAINKFWGLMIFDLQLRTSLRIIAADTAISDPHQWESTFAIPGSINTYTADPALPDGGKPEVVELQSPNSQLPTLINMLVQLAEYITGIFGVIQGNAESAPATLGATQSLQNFGTQRIKLSARSIEHPLNSVIYNVVRYIQKYTDKDKKVEYAMGANINPEEYIALDTGMDVKFKVRTTITNSLPTSRQMAAQIFTTLAGQVADPMAQKLLIEYGIKFLDLREGDEIAAQMGTIQQMQQQIEGMQDEITKGKNQMASMTQNMAQKDIALEVEKAKGNIKAAQASYEAQIDNNLNNNINEAPEQMMQDPNALNNLGVV